MPQVTVPPVSVNNLQTSLSMHSLAYTSALAHLQHRLFLSIRPVKQLRR